MKIIGVVKNMNFLLIFFIALPLLIIAVELRKTINKHFALKKVFSIKREVKNLKKEYKYKPVKLSTSEQKEYTYLGESPNHKPIYMPNNAKHILINGTTGSGKTVALANFIKSAVDNNYPLLIVDGKGDIGEDSIYDIVNKLKGTKKLYVVNMNDPMKSSKYNPFKNASPTIIKDMLINMTEWSEEHYKLNTERYLQKLVTVLYKAEIALSFTNIIKYIPTDKFSKFSAELVKKALMSKDEHIENLEIAKISGKIAENASSRFSTIAESEAGVIFDENGIDIYAALRENAIILFILNPLIYPELSPRMGRLILIDSKKAVQYYFGDEQRKFFVFDEINVYASPTLLDLANKSRSAGIMCIFAAQSLSDLDSAGGEYFKEQIIENCNNFLALRQNSAVNAEKWANILGTRKNLDVTYQLTNNGGGFTEDTGYGSARRVHEFLYHPDEIKTFPTGHGIYMCKDNNTHSKIIIHKPF